MVDAPVEPRAGASLEPPGDRRTAWRARSRWAVHLGLLCSAAAALGTLDLLHVRIAIHTDVGLVFVGLVASSFVGGLAGSLSPRLPEPVLDWVHTVIERQ